MSTETDDKTQSKFPRASLRARNKTLMITPADVADYQVRSDERNGLPVDLDDVFDESLSAFEDDGLESNSTGSEAFGSSIANEVLSADGLEGADIATEAPTPWEAVNEGEADSKALDVATNLTAGVVDDIFAAPAGASVEREELFSLSDKAERTDPILRETRSLESSEPVSSKSSASTLSCMGSGVVSHGGAGSSALKSVAQELQDPHRESCSTTSRESVIWKKRSKLVGFLVSYASDPMGSYIELREGRLLITNGQSSNESCLVIADETVSPMHAIMRISADGSILILDQLSEHGTRVQRAETGKEESLMGDKSAISHGDVVMFGDCQYHVAVLGSTALTREA